MFNPKDFHINQYRTFKFHQRIVGPPWGGKPSGETLGRNQVREHKMRRRHIQLKTLRCQLIHHISSIRPSHRRTNRGTRRSNHLVEKTFDTSHKYSLKPGRSTIDSDTTCWATVGRKTVGRETLGRNQVREHKMRRHHIQLKTIRCQVNGSLIL
ncbi:hypothetical protein PIB30_051562 [Stylosanthes scabra]|uniref:Uncharacterized protein n=1 Tax=Stylosanthes scabra TaxID=79078 RepID=A0ABU6QI97_9FABA|nr:hypothetical protein [Stylosanthes scabra]